jgi:cell division protein FtsA
MHTAVVGVGGDHFTTTSRWACARRCPMRKDQAALRCALSGMVDEDETMEVASVGGRKPRDGPPILRRSCRQRRGDFHLVWDDPPRRLEKSLNPGIVPPAGLLDGMPEIAEQIFDLRSGAAARSVSVVWPTTSTARRSRPASGS